MPEIGENYKDGFENSADWSGSWTFATDDVVEGQSCLKPTDGNYQPSMDATMRRIRPFDLRSSSIKAAEMSFWTKFSIEKNYDYASIEFSVDSLNWTTVCTDKSVLSSPFSQQAGSNIIPIWDGFQNRWQKEYIDLTDYLGNKLWVRFVFHSDDFTEFDGFRVDDIQVKTGTNLTRSEKELSNKIAHFQLKPNPSQGNFKISTSAPKTGKADVVFYNLIGKIVYEQNLVDSEQELNTNLPAGVYFAKVKSDQSVGELIRVVIQ